MIRVYSPRRALLIIVAVSHGVVLGQALPAPQQPPLPVKPPSASSQPAWPLDAEVDRLLTRLEQRSVEDLRAELVWENRYALDEPEDAVRKIGELWFQDTKPAPRFLAKFREKLEGSRRQPLGEQHYFDGFWFVERDDQTKSVTRRQVRRPDDPINPYKVGQGMFPLPFGQKKDDILREFEVRTDVPGPDAPENTDRLRLTPRAESDLGRVYGEVEFWIAREGKLSGLPLRVRAAKRDGTGRVNSFITVTFSNAQLNQGLGSSVFKIEVPAGFNESVEPLPDEAPPR